MTETKIDPLAPLALAPQDEPAEGTLPTDVVLARVQDARLAKQESQALVDQLSRLEDGLEIWKRRMQVLDQIRLAAIARTQPEHWVLFRSKDGTVLAYPKAQACDVIAEAYGVEVTNLRPRDHQGNFAPERHTLAGDDYLLRGWCDAVCHVTGRKVESLEAGRATTEQFTGRGSEQDLRSALATALRTKAVRVLTGLSMIPVTLLQRAGLDVSRCTKGAGFGKSKDRAASRVTADEVKAEARKLGDEILRRTGGDEDAARALLSELLGVDSVARITTDAMVRRGWAGLRAHPVFGDQKEDTK